MYMPIRNTHAGLKPKNARNIHLHLPQKTGKMRMPIRNTHAGLKPKNARNIHSHCPQKPGNMRRPTRNTHAGLKPKNARNTHGSRTNPPKSYPALTDDRIGDNVQEMIAYQQATGAGPQRGATISVM